MTTTPQTPVDALMALVRAYSDAYATWHCERLYGTSGTYTELKWAEAEAARAAVEASASALAAMPAEPVEMSPEFTDTARAALLWVLWHHQGSSSKVGQPIRYALGMGQHEHLNDHQLSEAKRWGKLEPKPSKDEHPAPYRCLKPHCPPRCSGCNHAIPVTDRPRMLMVNLLDQLAFDELGLPFEEGDSLAVDAARAWLCEPPIAQQAGGVPAGFVEWLKTREADSYSCGLLVRDALERLAAAPSPSAVKPLSEAQIEELRGEANRGFNIDSADYLKAFRDAERAHGIVTPKEPK